MTFSRLWLALFAFGILALLLGGITPVFTTFAIVWDIGLFLMAVIDYRTLPAKSDIIVDREVDSKLKLGASNTVQIRISNSSSSRIRLELIESAPSGIDGDLPDNPITLELSAHSKQAVSYHLTPNRRGNYEFGDISLRIQGRMGLVRIVRQIPAEKTVKVYPDFETAQFSLMARKGRLKQIGIRNARMQGLGREFESLRDYMPDDEMRRIDWKATARRGKLVARQYEIEKSQNVILAIDIGRTMLAEIDGVQKIEHAIKAALVLAYVATLSEDRVGLLLFSDRIHTYLPPQKGRAQVYAIMEALHNLEASLVEPDYQRSMAQLQTMWRRRSRLVCFTDIWDADSSRSTISELAALQSRHLVAAVTLLDTHILRISQQTVTSADSAFEKAVAIQTIEDRSKAMAELKQRGVLVVDSPADKLSADLVNRYLRVKEHMLL